MEESANVFINTIIRNIQMLCQAKLPFNQNIEVIGHLYLNIDSDTRLNYIVNEKCCKTETEKTFTSNSFHAEKPGNTMSIVNQENADLPSPSKLNRKKKLSPIKLKTENVKIPKLTENEEEKNTTDNVIENAVNVTFLDSMTINREDDEQEEDQNIAVKEEIHDMESSNIYLEEPSVDDMLSADTLEGGSQDEMMFSQSPSNSQSFSSLAGDELIAESSLKGDNVRLLKSVYGAQIPESEVDYTVVEMGTKQGRPMLVDSLGYSYTIRKRSPSCVRWWCSVRNKKHRCPASISQRGDFFRRGLMEHVHDATPGLLTATLVKAEIRSQASNDFVTPTSEVVERCMSVKGEEEDMLINENNLKRMINRQRQMSRNKIFS